MRLVHLKAENFTHILKKPLDLSVAQVTTMCSKGMIRNFYILFGGKRYGTGFGAAGFLWARAGGFL